MPTANDITGAIFGTAENNGVMDGFRALSQVITTERLADASQTLRKYRDGKQRYDARIVENERWYRQRHWDVIPADNSRVVKPSSGWLFNVLANKHAAAMDNYPSPVVLPREETDKAEAKKLTSIIPVILEQNDFELVYDRESSYKHRYGTGCYGVFWDSTKLGGLGDIAVRQIDILNLFVEPGVTDIQDSRNVFHVELVDNDILVRSYPQLEGKLGGKSFTTADYVHDDHIDTTNKSLVIDWYYKKPGPNGRQLVHYVKYVNDVPLFATEDDPDYRDRGIYDHGLYPFVLDPLFAVDGTPFGFGFIDVGKSAQEYIDRGNQAVLENMIANASPRMVIREGSGVNEDELLDVNRSVIHVQGELTNAISPLKPNVLNDIYPAVINNKIDELKEVTGNRDVNTGGSAHGVTAASALAALQEAGSKLDRDANRSSFRAFRLVVIQIIELIRQFYDLPRCFRIMGEKGAYEYIMYSNAGIRPQPQDLGNGDRTPLFDIQVSAEKASPYSKLSQNEMALQFYNAGFFNPQLADQAIMCLEIMDFDHKDELIQKIAQNGGMYQQMLMMQQQMEQLMAIIQGGGNASAGGDNPPPDAGGVNPRNVAETDALGGDSSAGSQTKRMIRERERVATASSPR